ncbi:hypothetical protein JOD64_000840 [Micromonospora luteifusca]|uniref:Uncharacterized protein n=1 Tax=Micromonospora luteifusca TaxID=709860 RepID=A0ABS2LN67_9ACTN|nr:hypothetical protein [Micromonospora luteifusca]
MIFPSGVGTAGRTGSYCTRHSWIMHIAFRCPSPSAPAAAQTASQALIDTTAGRVRLAFGGPLAAALPRVPSLPPGSRPASGPRPARRRRPQRLPAAARGGRRIRSPAVRCRPPRDAAHRTPVGPAAPRGGRPSRRPPGARGGVRGGRAALGALRPGVARPRLRTRRVGGGVGQPARGPPQLHPRRHGRARHARGAPPGGTRGPRLSRLARSSAARAARPTADARSGPGRHGDGVGHPVGPVRPDPVHGDPGRDAALRWWPVGRQLTVGSAATAGHTPSNPSWGTRTRRARPHHHSAGSSFPADTCPADTFLEHFDAAQPGDRRTQALGTAASTRQPPTARDRPVGGRPATPAQGREPATPAESGKPTTVEGRKPAQGPGSAAPFVRSAATAATAVRASRSAPSTHGRPGEPPGGRRATPAVHPTGPGAERHHASVGGAGTTLGQPHNPGTTDRTATRRGGCPSRSQTNGGGWTGRRIRRRGDVARWALPYQPAARAGASGERSTSPPGQRATRVSTADLRATWPPVPRLRTTRPAIPCLGTTRPAIPRLRTTGPAVPGLGTTRPAVPRLGTTRPAIPGLRTAGLRATRVGATRAHLSGVRSARFRAVSFGAALRATRVRASGERTACAAVGDDRAAVEPQRSTTTPAGSRRRLR